MSRQVLNNNIGLLQVLPCLGPAPVSASFINGRYSAHSDLLTSVNALLSFHYFRPIFHLNVKGMNNRVIRLLQAYLAISAHDRIEFIKEINRLERMPRTVRKDHENMINSLPR